MTNMKWYSIYNETIDSWLCSYHNQRGQLKEYTWECKIHHKDGYVTRFENLPTYSFSLKEARSLVEELKLQYPNDTLRIFYLEDLLAVCAIELVVDEKGIE